MQASPIHGVRSHVDTHTVLHAEREKEEAAKERTLDTKSLAANVKAHIVEGHLIPCTVKKKEHLRALTQR